MWVVKLGGSLLGSPELQGWLQTLVKISDGKIVIVRGEVYLPMQSARHSSVAM